MTNKMKWTGIIATLVIIVILPLYLIRESSQQEDFLDDYNFRAVLASTDLYAENCAVCHGAAGEGVGDNSALNSEAVRMMSETDLNKVISRGRDATLMAAWALEEGGIFSNTQIDDFVIFIQQVDWVYVEARVAELGFTPPEVITMEVSEEMQANLVNLPGGEALNDGLLVYAESCAACHGNNGAGTATAPAIDSADLRAAPEEDIFQVINIGIPGTLMAGWQNILLPEQISSLVDLLYRWPEIMQAGVDFPEVEIMSIPSSPELIAAGDKLFNIACKSCHGVDGIGSPMAPSLNNQVFISETPDEVIYQIIAGGVPDTLMAAWGSRLNDQDIQSLVAFLRSQGALTPTILPPTLGD